ncbi:hypothetical protein ACFVZW_33375 [Streptomyces sp. NPDC059567]|uniref:hypothetical protein n=1 Tax=Streptomyces sp. NPDC059567 TaxID=3346867 RepID=UPI00367894DA
MTNRPSDHWRTWMAEKAREIVSVGDAGGFVPNASVHCELNYALPEDGAGYRRLVEEWFADAAQDLSAAELDPFAHDLDLSGRGAALRNRGSPCGEPGELWDSLWVARMSRGRRTRSGRVWSPKEWASFLDDLEKVPLVVTLRLTRLGADGFPAGPWLTVTAERDFDAPHWVQLMADRSAEEFFAQPLPRRPAPVDRVSPPPPLCSRTDMSVRKP